MNVSDNLKDALYYPLSNTKSLLIVYILLILATIPIVNIFVTFILNGYAISIIRNTLQGNMELPEFQDFGDMIVDAIKCFIVALVYSILFIIIFVIILLILILIFGSDSDIIFLMVIMAVMSVMVILPFLTYPAIVNMVLNDDISAAFNFNEIKIMVTNVGLSDYIINCIAIIFISIILSLLVITAPYAILFQVRGVTNVFLPNSDQ